MEPQGTVDSLVRRYREAIQVNDHRGAVQILRNLDKTDPSQNWKGNLAQAEKAFQVQLESAFEDALGKNDAQMAANLAREYLAEPWLITPIGNTVTAMRAYIVGFDAAQSRKPQHLGRQPDSSPPLTLPADGAYLPQPRNNGRIVGIIVAVCVVVIFALAAGIFVVWKDGEKK